MPPLASRRAALSLDLVRVLLLVFGFLLLGRRREAGMVGAVTVNVSVFDWVTYGNSSLALQQADIQATLAITANFFVAAQNFNDRRSDILPVLGTIPASCTVNISIVSWCDTQDSESRAVDGIVSAMQLRPSAFVGVSSPQDVRDLALFASRVAKVPLVSHWSYDEALSQKDPYSMFARTCQDDGSYAQLLANFLAGRNITHILIVHVNYYDANTFVATLQGFFSDWGIRAFSFMHSDLDAASIDSAFANMASVPLSIILCVTTTFSFARYFPQAAIKYNLVKNHLWLLTNYDRPISVNDVLGNPLLDSMMSGSIRLDAGIPQHDRGLFQSYVTLWRANAFADSLSNINSRLPPQGFGNGSSCANDANNLRVAQSFFPTTSDLVEDEWALAYDAIISIGLAACGTTADPSNGAALFNSLMNVNFQGLSGNVRFDPTTGNRPISTLQLSLWEWQLGQYVPFGQLSGSSWLLAYVPSSLQVQQYSALANVSTNPLGFPLQILGYTETALLLLCCVLTLIWLKMNWQHRVVINGQGPLLVIMVLGCMVASVSISFLTIDDLSYSPAQASAACMAAPAVFLTGMQLTLVGLLVKSWRVYRLFRPRQPLKYITLTMYSALVWLGIYMTLYLALIGLWAGLAPLQWQRVVLTTDIFGNAVTSQGQCVAPNQASLGFLLFFLILGLVQLLACGGIMFNIRGVPSEFQETSWMSYAVMLVLEVYVIGVLLYAAVRDNVVGVFVIASTGVCLFVLFLLFFMLVPKMHLVHTGRIMWAAEPVSLLGRVNGESEMQQSPPHRISSNANPPRKSSSISGGRTLVET